MASPAFCEPKELSIHNVAGDRMSDELEFAPRSCGTHAVFKV